MHQHDVIRPGGNRVQRVLDGLLTVLAAGHELNFFLEYIFSFGLKPFPKALDFIFA